MQRNSLTVALINTYNPADSCNYHTVTRFHPGRRERTTTMLRLVSLQMMATLIAGVIAGLLGGWAAMFSAVLGGICCVVPNGIMAFRLFASSQKVGGATPATFFIWEFVKIALTLALLYFTARLYHDLNWLALLCGFIVALKSYIILLFRH